jgi:hypothetical protein
MTLQVEWFDERREPQHPPDPRYPNGIDIDTTTFTQIDMKSGAVIPHDADRKTCFTFLRPYPAPRIGKFLVKCDVCGQLTMVTTAGRPDDPRSVRIPCKAN